MCARLIGAICVIGATGVIGAIGVRAALPLTAEERSAKFSVKRSVGFDDALIDGFKARLGTSETVVFDEKADPDLAKCVVLARNLLRLYSGSEKRAVVLAKFTAMKLGGPVNDHLMSQTEGLLVELRAALKGEAVPIGRLIEHSMGHLRHRALLYKFLADRTVVEPAEWSRPTRKEPISCAVEMTRSSSPEDPLTAFACLVSIDGAPFTVDLTNENPKITPQLRTEMVPISAKVPLIVELQSPPAVQTTAGPSASSVGTLEMLRFLPSELSDAPDDSKGKVVGATVVSGISEATLSVTRGLLRGRKPVAVRRSVAGRLYDLDKLLTDVEALGSALHANVSPVVGLHYLFAPSPSVEDVKAGAVAAVIAASVTILHDEPRGPILTEILKRYPTNADLLSSR